MDVRAYRVRVEALRGSHVESRHEVFVAACGALDLGDAGIALDALPRTSMRSTAKPFQLLPLVACGEAERLGFDDADLALLSASHHGTPSHAERVADLLRRIGHDEEDLRCGSHRPYFLDAGPVADGSQTCHYGPLHHNCSGNHAALLALARLCGDDAAHYLDAQSHAARRVLDGITALSGDEPMVLEDNCGAPCYDLPLAGIARLYRALAAPAEVRALPQARRARISAWAALEGIEAGLTRIAAALVAQPQWASSETSAATLLTRAVRAGLVVKHGGEGMLCAAHLDSGAAFALKVADGNGRAAIPALLFVLERCGWLAPHAAALLERHRELQLFGTRQHPIGRLRATPS